MNFLSYNYCVLATPEEILAFYRILSTELVDVIFLQETLGLVEAITRLLETMLLGWLFHALDVNGHSGGVVIGYNTGTIKLCSIWGGTGHIGTDIYSSELGANIRLINVYGP